MKFDGDPRRDYEEVAWPLCGLSNHEVNLLVLPEHLRTLEDEHFRYMQVSHVHPV